MTRASRRDLYALLGVARNASSAQVRSAYRARARTLHPDRNPLDPEAEEAFKRATRAYEVLSDPTLRARYDEFGEAGLREGFDPDVMRQYRDWRPPGVTRGGWSGNIGQIFGASSGHAARQVAPAPAFGQRDVDAFYQAVVDRPGAQGSGTSSVFAPGADVSQTVALTLGEALRGAEKEVNTGIYGVGTVRVRMPLGVRDGERVRVRGRGEPGAGGGPAGDLLLRVRVEPHPAFRREGDDLRAEVPVTVGEAYKGTTLSVPTPLGPREVVLPPGTASGDEVTVPGGGAPRRDGTRGDLVVRVTVRLPPRGYREAEALLDALDRLYAARIRDDLAL